MLAESGSISELDRKPDAAADGEIKIQALETLKPRQFPDEACLSQSERKIAVSSSAR